jgi:hypothetical protein
MYVDEEKRTLSSSDRAFAGLSNLRNLSLGSYASKNIQPNDSAVGNNLWDSCELKIKVNGKNQ